MDWESLKEYVRATDEDDQFVRECFDEARDLVEGQAGKHLDNVPESVLYRAMKEVGDDLYHRREAPLGVQQFNDMVATPVRIARDPLLTAKKILAPYLPPGIA